MGIWHDISLVRFELDTSFLKTQALDIAIAWVCLYVEVGACLFSVGFGKLQYFPT